MDGHPTALAIKLLVSTEEQDEDNLGKVQLGVCCLDKVQTQAMYYLHDNLLTLPVQKYEKTLVSYTILTPTSPAMKNYVWEEIMQ